MLCRDDEPGLIDLGDAVEWGHPDNAGLALWLLGVEGAIGSRWHDLTGKTTGGALSGGPTHGGTPWGQSGLTLAGGTQFATTTISVSAPVGIACWLLPSSLSSYQAWIGAGANGGLELRCDQTTGTLTALRQSVAVIGQSTVALVAGVWVRVVFGMDSAGNWRWWVNGQPAGNGSATTPSSQTLIWGGPTGERWAGGVAGLMVLGRSPDAGWVARDYDWSPKPLRDPRLRRYRATTYFTPPAAASSVYLPAFAGPALGF